MILDLIVFTANILKGAGRRVVPHQVFCPVESVTLEDWKCRGPGQRLFHEAFCSSFIKIASRSRSVYLRGSWALRRNQCFYPWYLVRRE